MNSDTEPAPAPTPVGTPRTDALIFAPNGNYFSASTADYRDLARTLERELTYAQAALAAKDREIEAHRNDKKKLHTECTDLAAERDQLRAEIVEQANGYAATIADLNEQLAATQQDKERLDWLASQSYYPHDHPKDGVFVVVSENVAPHGAFSLERDRDRKALRAAIDAARSSLPESGRDQP